MSRRAAIFDKIMARVLVEDRGFDSPCWVWRGPTSGRGRGGGYPRMCLDGATVAVHKAAWINFNGMVPPKKQLDHLCSVRLCVNPEHLELVTNLANQRRKRRPA